MAFRLRALDFDRSRFAFATQRFAARLGQRDRRIQSERNDSLAGAIFPEYVPAHIVADVLALGSRELEIQTAIENSIAVIDCSASVAVGRYLAHSYGGHRRMSIFLNPSGTDLVLLAEPADRSIRVD